MPTNAEQQTHDQIEWLRASLNEARHACYKAEAERDAARACARLWKRAATLMFWIWGMSREDDVRWYEHKRKALKTATNPRWHYPELRRALGLPDK